MPQKKKEKKTNKKSHKKKHLTQKQNIIFQSIPNYSSNQFTGHQNNKSNIQYGPAMQQESRTDNLVGDLVGRLISKIENNENKEVKQYTKEVQPINNNENTSNINIYNNVPGKTEDKKPDATPQTPDNPGDNASSAISDGIKNATRTATEDFFLNAGSGLAAIAGAALSTSGWRNRKAIRNSISNIPTNARNSLGSIRERFRSSSAYRPQVDVPSPAVSVPASNQAASIAASSRRPSSASSAEHNIIDPYFSAVGISPERSARVTTASSAQRAPVARPRSNSGSSSSVYYREGGGANLIEQFDNASATRSSNMRTPKSVARGLNTEQRTLLEQTLKKQGLDPTNLSPINQDILRGRPSGIQQRDIGASTRTVRAQTGEPHAQLQTPARRGRGRPQTNEYARPIGPARPVGRPQTNEYARPIGPARLRGRPAVAQAAAPVEEPPPAQTRTQTQRRTPAVTRKVGTKK